MSSVKVLLASTALCALVITQANAADLPRPVYQPAPMVKEFDGWYLRGDIGITNQRVKSLDNVLFASAPGFTWLDDPSFGTGITMGLGIGYQFNNWFRADLTGEYRGKTQFHALDQFNNGGLINTNDYTGKKSEWLFLANAYWDLGTWWCITPFIGVGAGLVDITISNFRDNNIIAGGGGFGPEAHQTNFAWALHAGLAYKVNQNFAVEFGYRYLNLGDAKTGDAINFDGSNLVNNPFHFKDITSHDFRIGMRFMCCDDGIGKAPVPQAVYAPPPAPVYTQPQYAPPPPLMRKG